MGQPPSHRRIAAGEALASSRLRRRRGARLAWNETPKPNGAEVGPGVVRDGGDRLVRIPLSLCASAGILAPCRAALERGRRAATRASRVDLGTPSRLDPRSGCGPHGRVVAQPRHHRAHWRGEAGGSPSVRVVSFGFVFDHLEVLYNHGIGMREFAETRDVRCPRVPQPNDARTSWSRCGTWGAARAPGRSRTGIA